jgi:ABC-type Fe3+ transport system permease subunit
VVMPNGLAVRGAGPPRALTGLSIDSRHRSAGLVRTAVLAVERIAQARGRPIAAVGLSGSRTGQSSIGSLVVALAATVLLLVCGVPIARRLRRRATVPSAS